MSRARSGERTLGLPRLSDDSSCQVVRGLTQFNDGYKCFSNPGTQSPFGEHPLRSISSFGTRANSRVAEADAEFSEREALLNESSDRVHSSASESSASGAVSHLTGGGQPLDQVSFDDLLMGIDTALACGTRAITTVRHDQEIVSKVPLGAVMHFKVPLPSRPTSVTVAVARSSGPPPLLWASTSCERPHSRNHEVRGKGGVVRYDHVLQADDTVQLDRRHAVPSHRELFVTLQAATGACAFRLSVAFKLVKVQLTRKELATQVQVLKGGWEVRVAELQAAQDLRDQFDGHLDNLREAARAKLKDEPTNHKDKNRRAVCDAAPRPDYLRRHKRALQRCARQDAAAQRREEAERQCADRMMGWIKRSATHAQPPMPKELQRTWLVRLAAGGFAVMARRAAEARRAARRPAAPPGPVAGIIARFVYRCRNLYPARRRRALYGNVLALRVAVIAYARGIYPVCMHASQPKINAFLQHHAFNRDTPNFIGIVKRFRQKVMMVQKWWFEDRIRRRAYIDCLAHYWSNIEVMVQKELAIGRMEKEHEAAEARQEMQKMIDQRIRDIEAAHGHGLPKSRLSRAAAAGLRRGTAHVPDSDVQRGPRSLATLVGQRGSATAAPAGQRGSSTAARAKARPDIINRALTFPVSPANNRCSSSTSTARNSLATPRRRSRNSGEDHIRVDRLPDCVIRYVLGGYVSRMRRSRADRVRAWERSRLRDRFRQDVEAFSGAEEHAAKTAARPAVVYIDRLELEALIRQTAHEMELGEFRHVIFDRCRVLRRWFAVFARLLGGTRSRRSSSVGPRSRQRPSAAHRQSVDLDNSGEASQPLSRRGSVADAWDHGTNGAAAGRAPASLDPTASSPPPLHVEDVPDGAAP